MCATTTSREEPAAAPETKERCCRAPAVGIADGVVVDVNQLGHRVTQGLPMTGRAFRVPDERQVKIRRVLLGSPSIRVFGREIISG